MSDFSDVDASLRVGALSDYLRQADSDLSAMKAYVAAALGRAVPGGRVLDLGCGMGQDLRRLHAAGLVPIGLDPSRSMLDHARGSGAPLVRGRGERLPLADGTFDGCRIERVLQHVGDPAAVIAEGARILRPGGVLMVFEPDYTSMRATSTVADDLPGRLVRVRQPAVGGGLVELCDAAGLVIDDVVSEASYGYSLESLPQPAEDLVTRAAVDGTLDRDVAARWLDEQRASSEAGTFRAGWVKVLVVAHRP